MTTKQNNIKEILIATLLFLISISIFVFAKFDVNSPVHGSPTAPTPAVLAVGLYETGTDNLIKSYEQLIEDGDITITNGAFKFVNTELTGDFVCGNPENITSLCGAFSLCSLTSIDLSNLDTSNVTNMFGMFDGCTALSTIDLSNFDTSNVTDMSFMFQCCDNLISLDLSNFDTSNVTNMDCMFFACINLTSLDLSNFDTSKVTNMSTMFEHSSALTTINLSGWDTSNVTDMKGMFGDCPALTDFDIAHFNTSKVTNMECLFDSCLLDTIDLSSWTFNGTINVFAMFASYAGSEIILPSFANATLTAADYMFFGISPTCSITYLGTKAEWQSIVFVTEDTNYLSGMTIHCSDGDLVME